MEVRKTRQARVSDAHAGRAMWGTLLFHVAAKQSSPLELTQANYFLCKSCFLFLWNLQHFLTVQWWLVWLRRLKLALFSGFIRLYSGTGTGYIAKTSALNNFSVSKFCLLTLANGELSRERMGKACFSLETWAFHTLTQKAFPCRGLNPLKSEAGELEGWLRG